MDLSSTETGSEQVNSERLAVEFQPKKEDLPNMAPPKVGACVQTTRKTCSNHKSPQETTKEEQGLTQTEGIVNVDAIPSRQGEPKSTTLVEE